MREKLPILLVSATLLAAAAGMPITAQQPSESVPTFTKDVAPILYKHCVSCHRPGEAAPMSLLTYEQARPYARAIANAVANRTMPPWHADAPPGTFHNERILSDVERQRVSAWLAGGALHGDANDLPSSPAFVEGWSLGKPDVVLEMQEEYNIPARGTVEYEYLYIPANFAEPKWVTSIEIRPGNRKAVHHVLVYYIAKPDVPRAPLTRAKSNTSPDQTTNGQKLSTRRSLTDGVQRRLLATYAPGTNPQAVPNGTAFRLDPGGTLELQMHYTTVGEPVKDRTQIGFVFSKDPAPREVLPTHFFDGTFTLPAGAADMAVTTHVEFLQDATVWGLFPHTHLRGKKWDYKLQLPSGETKSILAVPRYDFNWQTYYMFTEPLQVPKGSKIVSTAWYDNSAANKNNPDPKVNVKWGDQTWEEMQYTGILVSPN
ncbi:MAG: cytochrome c [Vicinamibacterales bacterium]